MYIFLSIVFFYGVRGFEEFGEVILGGKNIDEGINIIRYIWIYLI